MKANNIENIIDSINEIQKAEAPLFFATRLKSRMQKQLVLSNTYLFAFKKPVYVVAGLLILLCFNIFLLSSKTNTKNISKFEHMHPSSTIDAFNSDYQLITNTSY